MYVCMYGSGRASIYLRGGGVGGQGHRVAHLEPGKVLRGHGHRFPSHAGAGVRLTCLLCMYVCTMYVYEYTTYISLSLIHTYIHTYIHQHYTYIHTYIHAYIHA